MGAITRSIANNITTGGVFTSSAITNNSVTGITVLANAADGITLISSQTASASATISFTTGLDSTYKAYKFVLVNMHPATDDTNFTFNLSTDSGSNYNATKTTTVFDTEHAESDASTSLTYNTGQDLAQSTSFQPMASRIGNGNDEHYSGTLFLFNPSSTTYVKHFIGDGINYKSNNIAQSFYIAGYANTASAVNAIQFKFASGNIDAGTIYLYGIK
jgi:hypothetical protein